ncbi:MAG: DOPA 4,5-dioxygenase family protein [Proteobacteria bacterium]|nr:DOPA 4,5-dioxygenase family protein [Pseudomonadota bacterium]
MEAISKIKNYHAHIYYDPATSRDRAAKLREEIAATFEHVVVGKWHDEPVGPHGGAMYQVAFEIPLFPEIVPWLSLNRNGLSVLVHPRTGQSRADHIDRAIWLGEPVGINMGNMRKRHPEEFADD